MYQKIKIKGKSEYVICLTKRTFTHKIEDEYDLETELEFYLQYFINCFIKPSMLIYCVKCRKNAENLDLAIFKTKNGRLIMQSKCANCGIKKSRFVKEHEAKGLLSNLGIKTPMSKIPLSNVLF